MRLWRSRQRKLPNSFARPRESHRGIGLTANGDEVSGISADLEKPRSKEIFPMKYQVENGGARPPKVELGASVVHRKDTKQQKAAKAADVYDGLAVFQPTQGELAYLYGVSVALINRARQLPPEQRKLVATGRTRLSSPARVQTLPKPASPWTLPLQGRWRPQLRS
jgi:hypothetical protein